MTEIEKYYYKRDKIMLSETCQFVKTGAKIGSSACSKCEHNIEHSDKEEWVKCDIINKAIGKKK